VGTKEAENLERANIWLYISSTKPLEILAIKQPAAESEKGPSNDRKLNPEALG